LRLLTFLMKALTSGSVSGSVATVLGDTDNPSKDPTDGTDRR
jgi:hypothetical protein